MPRLANHLIKSAWRISSFVALLLRSCRDVPSAKNELRWISEHVSKTTNKSSSSALLARPTNKARLFKLCKARSKGVPLQYILGTQPFGDLEIKCRKGVLIPRSETEAYTLEMGRILLDEIRHGHSSSNIKNQQQSHQPQEKPRPKMRILDICSGTGCISLGLYAQLRHACPDLQVAGLDISPKAINLSRENITFNNLQPRQDQSMVSFQKADIFSPLREIETGILRLGLDSPSLLESSSKENKSSSKNRRHKWDLIISNPPYISSTSFSRDTTRSVRNFEPKLALVPPLVAPATDKNLSRTSLTSICKPEDIFYARILDLSRTTLKPRRILFEVADLEQARRVVELAFLSTSTTPYTGNDGQEHEENGLGTLSEMYKVIQIWRDDPSCSPSYSTEAKDTAVESTSEEDGKEDTTETLRTVTVNQREIPIRGSGNVRAVYFFTGQH
ncbi:S-adenosyl-L-methionine-dependent methyltransferase [Rhypophila sp. PSN 637]